MIINSVVSSPIAFPKIVPNDWDRWWKLWTTEATIVTKPIKTHNKTGGAWVGLNVYVKPGLNSIEETSYDIKDVICPELFPSLFDNLDSFPMDISVMQVVSSRCTSPPHADYPTPRISMRSMIYDNNFTPTFYYVVNGEKKYQTLPHDTNTWIYHDSKYNHGSDYYHGHGKHLVIYHGTIKRDMLEQNLLSCHSQYNDYIIKDNNTVSSNT
jgi:hypothetical protein